MLIGITGKKRSGKDTFASLISELSNDDITIYKFAQPLKKAIKYGFDEVVPELGITFEDLDGDGIDREKQIISNEEAGMIFVSANYYLGIPILSSDVFLAMTNIKIKDTSYSIRELLQVYGTDIVRELYRDDYWIECAKQKYLSRETKHMIITDCRFDNEIKLIEYFNGRLFHVVRDYDDINKTTTEKHISENGITDYSYATVIKNDGTIDDLKNHAIKTLEELNNDQ